MSERGIRFPNEAADYRAAREELLRAEAGLRKHDRRGERAKQRAAGFLVVPYFRL